MIDPQQAKTFFPLDQRPPDEELEAALAFFYFLGEQAYEQVQKEYRKAGGDKC